VGYDIGLEFAKSEVFKGLNGGDLKAISYSAQGNTFTFKPRVRTTRTNFTVTTNKRRYYIEYSATDKEPDVAAGNVVYVVRFIYAPGAEPELTPAEQVDAALNQSGRERSRNFDYWFCGRQELKPIAAFDDGVQTHITFSPRAEIPAVFLKNEDGTESLVNFTATKSDLIVHRVIKQLVLRRGRLVACIVNKSYKASGDHLDSGTVSGEGRASDQGSGEVSPPELPPNAEESGVARSGDTPAERSPEIAGERGIPSVNRMRSMQSRVTSVLAVGFISLMTLGLLAWYYTHTWQKTHDAGDRARTASQRRALGEMTLPPLPHLQPPHPKSADQGTAESNVWGAAPAAPPGPAAPMAYRPHGATGRAGPAPDRRLIGPVFSAEDDSNSETRPQASAASLDARRSDGSSTIPAPIETSANGSLAGLLRPTATPATFARVLPTQRLLLPRGWKIDCTLETAIDSSLQGLVTCVTPVDIFGSDGSTVLLPRGSQLTGETRGEARQGLARVFVLWTEARTPPPDGVVALLDSPGTDELGRSGLPGQVNRHFFERFGAALLTSVVEGAIENATRPRNGDSVILNPSETTSVATEVLKSTVNMPPTILKHNGERIQILVARDVDFRSVYELRPTTAR